MGFSKHYKRLFFQDKNGIFLQSVRTANHVFVSADVSMNQTICYYIVHTCLPLTPDICLLIEPQPVQQSLEFQQFEAGGCVPSSTTQRLQCDQSKNVQRKMCSKCRPPSAIRVRQGEFTQQE